MKKIISSIICVALIITTAQAQTSIVGKWKLAKFVSPEVGAIPIDSNKIKDLLYQEKVTLKKDTALNALDSADVETLTTQLYSQFSTTLIEYKANKTYTGTFGPTTTSGTYMYNPAKKTLTTKPKGKTAKTAVVSFEEGMLVFNDKKENITMYFMKIK